MISALSPAIAASPDSSRSIHCAARSLLHLLQHDDLRGPPCGECWGSIMCLALQGSFVESRLRRTCGSRQPPGQLELSAAGMLEGLCVCVCLVLLNPLCCT